jgi:methylphosphotriester-DNA--protein-cysteine methyltransferase
METNEAVKVEFVSTNVFIHWPCDACGGKTDKVSVLAEVRSGQFAGFRVCEQCLERGQEATRSRMLNHADDLEREATRCRSLSSRIELPTFDEWEAKEKQAEEQQSGWSHVH